MATYRTNRSIVKWVSGNTVIPTDWRVLSWSLRCVTYFVIVLVLQECTNNGFWLSTTEQHWFSSDLVCRIQNLKRLTVVCIKYAYGRIENLILYATIKYHVCWSCETWLLSDSTVCIRTDSLMSTKTCVASVQRILTHFEYFEFALETFWK